MLKQTAHAKRQLTPPQPFSAGVVMSALFKMDLSGGYVAADDKIELGSLMANSKLIGANLIGVGLGAITADVGIMSGMVGDNDVERTIGNELFDDESVNGTDVNADLLTLDAIAESETHRSIGAVLSGNVAAGAGKALWLRIEYHM